MRVVELTIEYYFLEELMDILLKNGYTVIVKDKREIDNRYYVDIIIESEDN